jgi:phosphoglycerate dehydrogenase-like enzyme
MGRPEPTTKAQLGVHLLNEPEPAVLEHLRASLLPSIHLTVGSQLPQPAQFRILVAGMPPIEQVTASPELDTLIIPWSGLPKATRALMLDRPHIAVHNLHYNAGPAAELAVALLLAAAKFVVPTDRSLRAGDWSPRYRPNPSIRLEGRCVLILGYGAIGQRVARMCRGLGMRVIGVRRRPELTHPDCPDPVYPPDSLRQLLPEAHAVAVCLPLTEKTEGLIGERELQLLPPKAILVNVARGPIVDERALFEALRADRLAAAGIDVWYNYPRAEEDRASTTPSAYPFAELDNVVMSPHRGGALGKGESEIMRMEALAASLNAAARGDEIPHRVDLAEGY